MSALAIAMIAVRRVYRDRTSLVFMLLLPVVITLVIGVTIFNASSSAPVIGVVPGEGALADDLVTALDRSDTLDIQRFSSPEGLRLAIRRETLVAGVVIPAGYDAALRGGERTKVEFLVNPRRTEQSGLRAQVTDIVARQAAAAQAAIFATQNRGGSFDENLRRATQLRDGDESAVKVRSIAAGRSRDVLPTGFGYTAPANLVLSVFITATGAAALLIETRKAGISRRMVATPTSTTSVVVGETLGRFLISFTQILIIFVVGTVAFGVDWGNLAASSVLLVLIALTAASLAIFLGTLFRTAEQAASVGPPLGIALGMLSGCMWPLEIVGPTMRTVGHLFPQAWAMDAFIETIARGAGIAGIAPQLGVLLLFTLVLLPLGTWRLKRSLIY